jgi:hypothetical protein
MLKSEVIRTWNALEQVKDIKELSFNYLSNKLKLKSFLEEIGELQKHFEEQFKTDEMPKLLEELKAWEDANGLAKEDQKNLFIQSSFVKWLNSQEEWQKVLSEEFPINFYKTPFSKLENADLTSAQQDAIEILLDKTIQMDLE